jgi:oxygen-independent coproporphyrinogen-3 oxidase
MKKIDFNKVISKIDSYEFMCYPPHYPNLESWPSANKKNLSIFKNTIKKNLNTLNKRKIGIYINMPFCASKCSFCYLNVYRYAQSDLVKKYVAGLKKEMSFYSKLGFYKNKISSIYISGGTASILNINYLKEIFEKLRENFNFDDKTQFTIETSTDFIDADKIALFKEYGVNFLMIGIQSFNQKSIKSFNRAQNVDLIRNKINLLKKNDIKFNIDLICGLDTLDEREFISQVKEALSLAPNIIHLNKFKPTESLEHKKRIEKLQSIGLKYLSSKGYKILDEESAVLGDFSGNMQGNINFLVSSDILALGPGSMGHINSMFRYYNHFDIEKYYKLLSENIFPIEKLIKLSYKDEADFYILVNIFNAGVNLNQANAIFDKRGIIYLKEKLEKLIRYGLVEEKGGFYKAMGDEWFLISKNIYNLKYMRTLAKRYGFWTKK